jgi:hypothetical protein
MTSTALDAHDPLELLTLDQLSPLLKRSRGLSTGTFAPAGSAH